MKIKRALGFGLILWIAAFMIISIFMFLPWFKESQMRVQIAWWVLEIPVVLLAAKWYFKVDPPTIKKGFLLGVIGLVSGAVLDMIITVPLFAKTSYAEFFGDWKMWVGYAIVLLLTIFAGFEFDKTFTKRETKEVKVDEISKEPKED